MYKRIDRVVMGSPLGLILADIFVGYLEIKLFLNFKSPLICLWYIDDTFVMFENRQESSSFVNYLNNLHKNLSFTKEGEYNSSINLYNLVRTDTYLSYL